MKSQKALITAVFTLFSIFFLSTAISSEKLENKLNESGILDAQPPLPPQPENNPIDSILDELQTNLPTNDNNFGFLSEPELYGGVNKADNDIMLKALTSLIGSPIHVIQQQAFGGAALSTGTDTTSLTKIIVIISTIAALFAAALIAFILGVSVFQQARTGKFLGEWDSWFVPLRVVGAGGLLIPIPKFGGLNGAQVLITVLFLMGIGFANFAAKIFVENAFTDTLIQPLSFSQSPSLVSATIKGQTCIQAYNDVNYRDLEPVITQHASPSMFWGTQYYTLSIKFGASAECGSTKVKKEFSRNLASVGSTQAEKKVYDYYINNFKDDYITFYDRVNTSSKYFYYTQIGEDQNHDYQQGDGAQLAFNNINNALSTLRTPLQNATEGFKESYENESFSEVTNNIGEGGFAMLGVYYWAITQRQNTLSEINDLGVNMGESTGYAPPSNTESKFNKPTWSTIQAIHQAIDKIPLTTGSGTAFNEKILQEAEDIEFLDFFQEIQSFTLSALNTVLVERNNAGEVDPMLTIRQIGNVIIAVVTLSFFTLAQVSAVAEGASLFTLGTTGAISHLANFFAVSWPGTVATILLGLGLLMATVIPMLPFIMMTMGVIGLLIYYLEALAGVSFWVAYHTHPDGNSFYGRAGGGYAIVFTLTLRPLFMVIGFAAGIAIFRLGANMFDTLFSTAFIWSTSGGTSLGFGTLFGSMIIYVGFLMALGYKSFQLSYEFPNFVNRWMGFSDHSDHGEQNTQQALIMGTNTAGHVGLQAAGALANSNPENGQGSPDKTRVTGDVTGGGGGGSGASKRSLGKGRKRRGDYMLGQMRGAGRRLK